MKEINKTEGTVYVAPSVRVLDVVAWNEICTYTLSYADPYGEGGDNATRYGYGTTDDIYGTGDPRYGGAKVEIWD
ncbi:MAG: hypothetical protein J5886_02410 [Bacteroidales bacterium]|nr:hypothetical protein [Bacteroidales bacterium]